MLAPAGRAPRLLGKGYGPKMELRRGYLEVLRLATRGRGPASRPGPRRTSRRVSKKAARRGRLSCLAPAYCVGQG